MCSKTIIHVTQSLGGVETYLRSFLEHGAFDAFDRRVLVVPERTALADAWECRGGTVVVVEMRRRLGISSDLRVIVQLRKLFKANASAIVHLHSSKAGALGRVASMLLGRGKKPSSIIYTPHAFYFLALEGLRRRIFLTIERILGLATDALLATSPSEAVRAIKDVGFKPGKVFCVSNAVEVVANVQKRNNSSGVFQVLFVGRVCRQKNIDLLLQVVSLFSLSDRIHFTLIGTGHYSGDRCVLEQSIARTHADPRLITIADWMPREELLRRYASSDLCLLTSRYESFGYVVAEANAVGTPVVSTDVDGVRDILLDGVTGLLIRDERPESFHRAITQLMSNPHLLEMMGREARRRIATEFSINENAVRLASFYRERNNAAA